jgi:hypothetical protein
MDATICRIPRGWTAGWRCGAFGLAGSGAQLDAEERLGMSEHLADGPAWYKHAEQARTVDLMTNRPHVARMYDYHLGGKDHYAADRAAAEAVEQSLTGRVYGGVARLGS